MPLVEVNGVQLLVEGAGTGDPVVLVHGSWDTREVWALVEPELTSAYRVVSYDRRGHGASGDSAQPGVRRDDEDDLAALIEGRGLAPAHVVGNSFGASVTLGLAARRPDLFRSICVHEPPLFSVVPPVAQKFRADMAPVAELIEQGDHRGGAKLFVDTVIGPGIWDELSTDEQGALITNAATFLGELRDPVFDAIDLESLAKLPGRVLLTRGDQSPPYFAPVVAELARLPPVEVTLIPGAGHEPHLTHSTEFVALVQDFVSRAG